MKANEMKVSEFLEKSNTVFSIPVYQRNYDWKHEQCQQLFEDILKSGENMEIKAHFIGSIVSIHDGVYSAAQVTELTIIDGQQRITTLILIYAVIRYLAEKASNKNLQMKIEEQYLKNKFAPESEKLKLKSTENNKDALNYVLNFKEGNDYNGYSKIIENFKFFKEKINYDNYEIILNGLNKLIFVNIALERGNDSPQRIFESMNSTGLDLSEADLIRNYILMDLKREEQEKLFKTYWEPIEKNSKDEYSNKNEVSRFIRDYLTLKTNDTPREDRVYSTFKKKFSNKDKLEEILSELLDLSVFYYKILNPEKEMDKEINQELEYIKQLEMKVTYPFLVKVYYDYSKQKIINKETFIEILKLLQSFVFRRLIAGTETNALNKIFMALYGKVELENYLYSVQKALLQGTGIARFPKNEEIMESLKKRAVYKFNPKNKNYLFEKLENYNNKELVSIEDLTIEHIFPQNPDPIWLKELGKEEYEFIKENYLHTIGNLTLSGNNGSLGNKSFVEKRDMNYKGREQGYKYSRLYLNRDLQKLEIWNKAEIEKRTEKITNRFLEIWTIPDIKIDSAVEKNEINIFEIESLEKIEYYILLGQKNTIKSKYAVDFFKSIIKQLFELEPEKFFDTEIKQKLKITTDENEFKVASGTLAHEKLNDEYYFCVNYSNNEKLKLIKLILEIFGYEDEMFIKLTE